MTSYAIVIGIDAYSVEDWRLGAAVNDALRFADWALGPGGVEKKDLRLLLATEADGPTPLDFERATSRNLRKAIVDFQKGAGEGGDRLYFYYAGHGLSAPGVTAGGSQEPVLIPSDVESLEIDANLLIGFSDLIPLFLDRGPAEQFFFIDACRDFGLEDFRRGIGGAGTWSPPNDDVGPRSAQYVLYATSPGQRAYEKDRGFGIFGSRLLDSLAGERLRLVWNGAEEVFEVRFAQLAKAVVGRVKQAIEGRRLDGWARFAQLPQMKIVGQDADPVLAKIPRDEVEKLPVKVRVGPSSARRACTVEALQYVSGLGREIGIQKAGPPATLPVKLELNPGDYSLTAHAPGFEDWRLPCEVISPRELDVRLEKRETHVPPAEGPLPTRRPRTGAGSTLGPGDGGEGSDEGGYGGYEETLPGDWGLESIDPVPDAEDPGADSPAPAAGPRGLRVLVDDPRARVELLDSRHEIVSRGLGGLAVPDLSAGIYRLQLVLPEGPGEQQTVEVRPGEPLEVELEAPATTIGDDQLAMLERVGISPSSNGFFHPSEGLAGIAGARLVSLLSYAAFALLWPDASRSRRLRALGLGPLSTRLPGGGPAVLVVVAANGDRPGGFETWDRFVEKVDVEAVDARLRVLTRGKLRPLAGLPAAGQRFFAPAKGGSVDVRIELPGLAPTHFAVGALPDRLTALILSAHDNGEVEVEQLVIPYPSARGREHELLAQDAFNVRAVEEAQRYFANGEEIPSETLEPILAGTKIDPLLGCLAGYSLVATGDRDQVARFAGKRASGAGKGTGSGKDALRPSALANLLDFYPELADVHVLAGLCEPSKRAAHFGRAMSRGLPIFSQGLQALERWAAKGERAPEKWNPEPARGRVPASVWTSWVVERPAIRVRNDTFDRPPLGWAGLIGKKPEIERVLRSVCRIEVPGHSTYPYFGTGFLVAPTVVMTSSDVALGLAVEDAGRWRLRSELRPQVDFREEAGASEPREFAIEEVLGVSRQSHVALLRIASTGFSGAAAPQPLVLATEAPEGLLRREVYVVGYPAADARTDPKVVERIFGGQFQVKRLQPGVALAVDEGRRHLFHDCFTLGGNGGSPVVDLESGEVLGLHYAGKAKGPRGTESVEYKMGIAIALWMFEEDALSPGSRVFFT